MSDFTSDTWRIGHGAEMMASCQTFRHAVTFRSSGWTSSSKAWVRWILTSTICQTDFTRLSFIRAQCPTRPMPVRKLVWHGDSCFRFAFEELLSPVEVKNTDFTTGVESVWAEHENPPCPLSSVLRIYDYVRDDRCPLVHLLLSSSLLSSTAYFLCLFYRLCDMDTILPSEQRCSLNFLFFSHLGWSSNWKWTVKRNWKVL